MASTSHYANRDHDTAAGRRTRHLTIAPKELAGHRRQADHGSVDGSHHDHCYCDCDGAGSLVALVEGEIIPRLMAAHTVDAERLSGFVSDLPIEIADIEALAPLVMHVDADILLARVESILDRGISVEAVMVDLLAPVARLLGEYWEDDRCDFVDVTMGLWRLQEVVHEIASRAGVAPDLAARNPAPSRPAPSRNRALFASMPGDQHSFGTVVLDEVFRRAGWLTERMSEVQDADLLQAAGQDWFDMIGLTISCDCHIADLTSIIAALRKKSLNSQVCIMVGGRIFTANPDLAVHVGADGTARDAKLALQVAGDLVRKRVREAAGVS